MILFIHLFLAVLGLRGYVLCSVAQSCLTLCGPWTLALQALLSMEVFLDKNTGGDCHFLPHVGIFPTWGSNPRLLLGSWVLYH